MSVGSLGFLSCCLLPFDLANLCFLAILPCYRRVVPCTWKFFVRRVGPHGCLLSGPPFSKHSQSSLEFLFMAGDPWEVAMVTPPLFALCPHSFAYCLHCSQLAPTLHFQYCLSTSLMRLSITMGDFLLSAVAHAHLSHCHIVLPLWLAWSCLAAFLPFVHTLQPVSWFFETPRFRFRVSSLVFFILH